MAQAAFSHYYLNPWVFPPWQSQRLTTKKRVAKILWACAIFGGQFPKVAIVCVFLNGIRQLLGCGRQAPMNFALVSKCKLASASSKGPERRSKRSAPRGAPSGYSQGGRGRRSAAARCAVGSGGRHPGLGNRLCLKAICSRSVRAPVGLGSGLHNLAIFQAREQERREGCADQPSFYMRSCLNKTLISKSNPKRWAFLLPQLPGEWVCDFWIQEGGLNLLEMRAPSKQIRLIKMGRISLCPVGMVFALHSPDPHLRLHKAAQTEKKADI